MFLPSTFHNQTFRMSQTCHLIRVDVRACEWVKASPYKFHPMLIFNVPRSSFRYHSHFSLASYFPFLTNVARPNLQTSPTKKWVFLSSSLMPCSSSCSWRLLSKSHWSKHKHVSPVTSTPTFWWTSGTGMPASRATISWQRCPISMSGSCGLSLFFNGLSCSSTFMESWLANLGSTSRAWAMASLFSLLW